MGCHDNRDRDREILVCRRVNNRDRSYGFDGYGSNYSGNYGGGYGNYSSGYGSGYGRGHNNGHKGCGCGNGFW